MGEKGCFWWCVKTFFFLERERRRFYRTGQVEAFRPSIFSSSSFSSYREVKKEDFPSRPVITSTIYGVFLFTLSNTRTQDVDRHKETWSKPNPLCFFFSSRSINRLAFSSFYLGKKRNEIQRNGIINQEMCKTGLPPSDIDIPIGSFLFWFQSLNSGLIYTFIDEIGLLITT